MSRDVCVSDSWEISPIPRRVYLLCVWLVKKISRAFFCQGTTAVGAALTSHSSQFKHRVSAPIRRLSRTRSRFGVSRFSCLGTATLTKTDEQVPAVFSPLNKGKRWHSVARHLVLCRRRRAIRKTVVINFNCDCDFRWQSARRKRRDVMRLYRTIAISEPVSHGILLRGVGPIAVWIFKH